MGRLEKANGKWGRENITAAGVVGVFIYPSMVPLPLRRALLTRQSRMPAKKSHDASAQQASRQPSHRLTVADRNAPVMS